MRAKPKEGQELNGNRAVIKTDQRIPSPAGTTFQSWVSHAAGSHMLPQVFKTSNNLVSLQKE